MTRNDFLFKWFWYAMALLPVWAVEALVFDPLHILGVRPMLLPLAAVAVAVLEGSVAGAGFGLGVGLLCSAAWAGEGPLLILALAVAGGVAGGVAQYGLKQSYVGCLICSAGALAAIDLGRILFRLVGGRAPLRPMLRLAVTEILVSLIFVLPIYLLFRKVYSKVGGTKLM